MRLAGRAFGDLTEPGRPDRGEVDAGAEGEQPLVGADVRRRLLAADVLLAGLQGEDPAPLAVAVDRLADDPAGHLADELLATRQDAQVRAAVRHRIAQALPLGDHDVGPIIARTAEDPQADRVDADDRHRPLALRGVDQGVDLLELPEEVGVLHDHRGGVVGDGGGQLVAIDPAATRGDDDDLGFEVGQVGRQDLSRLGVDRPGDDDPALPPGDGQGHEDRLGDRRAAVVEAGVRDVHAGQLADERLILERRLQGPLARLRLIRRVGRVELAASGQVVHDGRDEVVVAPPPRKHGRTSAPAFRPSMPETSVVSSHSLSARGIASGLRSRYSGGIMSNS